MKEYRMRERYLKLFRGTKIEKMGGIFHIDSHFRGIVLYGNHSMGWRQTHLKSSNSQHLFPILL